MEFSQIIGFFASSFIVLSFQAKKRKHILYTLMVGQVLFCIHFFMIGAYTGSALNLLSVFRSFVFSQNKKKWASKIFWLYNFIVLFWVTGFLSWEGYISLLPTVGMTIISFALWNKNEKKVRKLSLFARPFWFTYVLISKSYAGIITEILLLISIIIGIIRYDIIKKKK